MKETAEYRSLFRTNSDTQVINIKYYYKTNITLKYMRKLPLPAIIIIIIIMVYSFNILN